MVMTDLFGIINLIKSNTFRTSSSAELWFCSRRRTLDYNSPKTYTLPTLRIVLQRTAFMVSKLFRMTFVYEYNLEKTFPNNPNERTQQSFIRPLGIRPRKSERGTKWNRNSKKTRQKADVSWAVFGFVAYSSLGSHFTKASRTLVRNRHETFGFFGSYPSNINVCDSILKYNSESFSIQ